MPLSSVVGAQSIVRPGVCTSSTRPASPYDGQVIYETDTDKTLVYNGTGWVFLSTSRANPVGLDFIKAQTIGSAVSSVTVSDVFSSTYDNYKILINGGTCSNVCYLRIQLGSATSAYYGSGMTAVYSSGGYSGLAIDGASLFPYAGFGQDGQTLSMNCDVLSPNLAKWTIMNALQVYNSSAASFGTSFCRQESTTQFTAFTITPSAGTLTGGTIRVYGYVNS